MTSLCFPTGAFQVSYEANQAEHPFDKLRASSELVEGMLTVLYKVMWLPTRLECTLILPGER